MLVVQWIVTVTIVYGIYFNVKMNSFRLSFRPDTDDHFSLTFISILILLFCNTYDVATICSMFQQDKKTHFQIQKRYCLHSTFRIRNRRKNQVQIAFDINFKFDYGFTNRCANIGFSGEKFVRLSGVSDKCSVPLSISSELKHTHTDKECMEIELVFNHQYQ